MQIGLDHTRIDLRPGRPARLAVELHNDRPTAGMFTLSVDLPGTAWLTSSQPVVRVSHAETVVTTVEVHVGNDVVAGEHDAVLRATSVNDPDDVAVHRLRLVVGPAPSMRLVVAPSVVAGHVGASTTATVTNTGNTPLEVQYATRDPAGETQSRLSITHSRLLAGERRDVDVTITAPARRVGTPVRRLIGVSAVADGVAPVEEFVTFMHRPRVRRSVVRAAVAGCIAVVAGVTALVVFGLADREVIGKRVPPGFVAGVAEVQPTAVVDGRVIDAASEVPLSSVVVDVFRDLGDGSQASVGTTATDADGRWTVTGIAGGTHLFRFSRPGFDAIEITEVVIPATDIDIDTVVMAGRASSAEVVVAVDAPVDAVSYELTTVGSSEVLSGSLQVDDDGRARGRIDGVTAPGRHRLEFTAPGHIPLSTSFSTDADEAYVVPPLRLEAAPATLLGRTIDSSGEPLGGVSITVLGDGTERRSSSDAVTGSWGVGDIGAPGTITVVFTADGYATVSRAVDVDAGSEAALDDVVLTAARGVVSGRVLDAQGLPVGSARVVLRGGDLERVATSSSTATVDGPAGSFRISGVEVPGTYTVGVSAPGYVTATVAIDLVTGDGADEVLVTLERATVAVTGVVRVDGVGTGGLVVTVDDGRVMRTAVSADDPAGAYAIADVSPGVHTIGVTTPDGRSASTLVDVVVGSELVVDLSITSVES